VPRPLPSSERTLGRVTKPALGGAPGPRPAQEAQCVIGKTTIEFGGSNSSSTRVAGGAGRGELGDARAGGGGWGGEGGVVGARCAVLRAGAMAGSLDLTAAAYSGRTV
jgi:hypothetical protein